MARDRFIVRVDNVGDLISEYTTISWACARESVLELMEGEKRLHLDTEKRIFDGNDSRPIHIEEK